MKAVVSLRTWKKAAGAQDSLENIHILWTGNLASVLTSVGSNFCSAVWDIHAAHAKKSSNWKTTTPKPFVSTCFCLFVQNMLTFEFTILQEKNTLSYRNTIRSTERDSGKSIPPRVLASKGQPHFPIWLFYTSQEQSRWEESRGWDQLRWLWYAMYKWQQVSVDWKHSMEQGQTYLLPVEQALRFKTILVVFESRNCHGSLTDVHITLVVKVILLVLRLHTHTHTLGLCPSVFPFS